MHTWYIIVFQLTVLGTPGEEMEAGKVEFIRANTFSDIDMAMMAHPSPLTVVDGPPIVCMDTYVSLPVAVEKLCSQK